MINVSSLAPPIYTHTFFESFYYDFVSWCDMSSVATRDMWHTDLTSGLNNPLWEKIQNIPKFVFFIQIFRRNSLKVVKTNKPRHQVVGWNSENSFLNIYKVIISIHIMWWNILFTKILNCIKVEYFTV